MSEKIRTNPFLQLMPEPFREKPAFTLKNLVTNEVVLLDDVRLLPFLDYLSRWRTKDKASSKLSDLTEGPPSTVEETVERLLNDEILIVPGTRYERLLKQTAHWADNGWLDALYLYVSVFDIMKEKKYETEEWIKRARTGATVPPVYKDYPTSTRISLERPTGPGEFSLRSAFRELQSRTSTPSTRLTRSHLSSILYYTFGQTGKKEVGDLAEFVTKTSPSGGARHPVEVYVWVSDCRDIPAGLYHYSVRNHALEMIDSTPGVRNTSSSASFRGDISPSDTRSVMFFTASVERDMMKYKNPRCYNVIQQDLGHLFQTLRLTAASKEYTVEPLFNVDELEVAELLAINPIREPVIGGAVLE